MSGWWQEARVGAARQFGARHYRKFAAAGALHRLRVPIVVAVLAGGGVLAWRAAAHASVSAPSAPSLPWPWIAGGAAAVAALVLARARLLAPLILLAAAGGAGWLLWWAVTHVSLPWRTIGITVAVLALAAAAKTRLLVPLLAVTAAGGAGWLLWHAITAWSLPWPWLAGAAALALLLRRLLRYRTAGLFLRLPHAGRADTEHFDI